MRSTRCLGFTLIELLVVVGVVGVIAAMILPSVQAAREAARRVSCASNLKQLGLAAQSYETGWGVFPPSPMTYMIPEVRPLAGTYFSSLTALLPHLEKSSVHNATNFQVPTMFVGSMLASGINITYASTRITTFLCPSDGVAGSTLLAPTNYRVNAGLCGYCGSGDRNGVVNSRGVATSGFTDGLSNTLLYSEKLVGDLSTGGYHPNRDWILNWPAVGSSDPQAISVDDWVSYCSNLTLDPRRVKSDAGMTWMLAGTKYTEFLAGVSPNSATPDCGGIVMSGSGIFAARSLHPLGVNAVLADGSVHFFPSSTNVNVWRALGTRAGGETTSAGL